MNEYTISNAVLSLLFSLVLRFILGAITQKINESKGHDGGFAWGFWLGWIGIIVVACRRSAYEPPASYHPPVPQSLPVGSWQCSCGRTHSSYENSCVCGATKKQAPIVVSAPSVVGPQNWVCTCGRVHGPHENSCVCGNVKNLAARAAARPVSQPQPTPQSATAKENDNIALLHKYKELLDEGAITQEEYEIKKKSLLNL